MINIFLIFLGSGIGGLCRYGISVFSYIFLSTSFPYGTLLVNLTGCFLIGILYVLILERFNGIGEQLRALLLIGFLGGYTTFSSFSIETIYLYENGNLLGAFINVLFSLIFGLFLTWFGLIWGRQL